jgi:Protein of unknown function (DUF1572)
VIEQQYLDDVHLQLRKLKAQVDKAIAQVGEENLFALIDPDANSIAIIMKHMTGNMRSRWTDFLTSDGEKPDRNRDAEFELHGGDTRASLIERWEREWTRLLETIASLAPEDLDRTVFIRGEAHSVIEAINRQVMHYAAHTGQIVLLAKHYAGPHWQSLSIPKGRSRDVDVSKAGSTYGVEKGRSRR